MRYNATMNEMKKKKEKELSSKMEQKNEIQAVSLECVRRITHLGKRERGREKREREVGEMKLREELIFVKPSFAKVEKSFSMLGAHSNVREMCVCVCRKRERERERMKKESKDPSHKFVHQ